MHKGKVYAQSEFGKGSKFVVELPTTKNLQEGTPTISTFRSKMEDLKVELSDIF